jgi:hypothetical protein
MTEATALLLAVTQLEASGTPKDFARKEVLETWAWAKAESLKAAPRFNTATGQPILEPVSGASEEQ